MKNICFLLSTLLTWSVAGQSLSPLGQFEHHQDVGNPKKAGSATYNADDQTYTLTGAGINMWTKIDQFHFLWKKSKVILLSALPSGLSAKVLHCTARSGS